MAKVYDEPITEKTDWGGDASTGNLPVSGRRVQEFIKSQLGGKFGFSRTTSDNVVQFFTSEAAAQAYDDDPDTNADKLLGFINLPEGGSGGGGAQYNLRVVNNLDSKSLYASQGEACNINFTFISQERFNSDEEFRDTGERGLCQISARSGNGQYTVVKQFYMQSNQPTEVDVAEFLAVGSNNIMIKITGEVTDQTTLAFVYTVQLTSLSISAANFRWWSAYNEDITIPLNIGGNIAKLLNVSIDGENYHKEYTDNIYTNVYLETAYNYRLTHPGKTGVFKVTMYVCNTDGTLRTKEISFNIMCVAGSDKRKLLVINNVTSKAVNWSENNLLDYAIYDGDNVSTDALVSVLKGEAEVYTSDLGSVPTQTRQTLNVPFEIETPDDSNFDVTARITDKAGSIDQSVIIPVDNSLGFSAVAGAVLNISPKKRTNTQSNAKDIINEADETVIPVTWSGMNWGNDGWQQAADGRVLRILSGSYANIDYQPFLVESARTGKTIEVDFKIENIIDYDLPVIQMQKVTADSFTGLKVLPDDIIFYSSAMKNKDNQSVNMKDGNRIRLTLTIMPDAYGNQGFNLAILYINGVKNREFAYESNDYFAQDGTILIGSDGADIDVYGIRAYDSALTSDGVMQNFKNWLADNEEKNRVESENDIMDANGTDISFEKVKEKYNVFTFNRPFPSLSNPNTMTGTWKMFWADHPDWNIVIEELPVGGQGTSSMKYKDWNLRGKGGSETKITYADGTTDTKSWTFVPGFPKISKMTAKKNFASSMQSHKMGSVNSIDDLAKEMELFNEANSRISVYQYPFVGFEESVNEEGQTVYTFKGLYTIGPDKGDDKTFGYDTDKFPDLLSIEGADNAPLMALFRVPWNLVKKYIAYNPDEEALQYNNVNCWDYNAGAPEETAAVQALFEKNWMPAYNFVYECSPRLQPFVGDAAALNTQVDELRSSGTDYWITGGDVYYYEAAEGMFIPADTGNGTINLYTQLVDKDYGLVSADLEGKSIEELNTLFINARVRKFRQEVEKVGKFSIDDAIFARNWDEFNAGTDNRTKNTYPYVFGDPELGYLWRWRHDDTDTIFDTTNQGQAKKPYWVEIGDAYDNGQPVWNGETSNFWNLIDLAFPEEIITGMRKMMAAMEKLGGLDTGTPFEKIYAFYKKYYFDQAQEYFPQSLYNADAKVIYENAKIAYDNGSYTNDTDPITQSLGDHYSAEQRWISKRIVYMMSKYSYGIFSSGGTDTITVRAAGDTITYELTPAMDMYPAIANGTSIIRGERTKAGEMCRMMIELSGSGDQQNTIEGASYLEDIGDWHDKNVTGSMIVSGKMIKQLVLGSKTEEVVISISDLTLSNMASLRKLVLSNITTLGGVLNLQGCTHLKEVYADGTVIAQLVLPLGGGIEVIEYSAKNQYISLQNYPLLTNEGVKIDLCKEVITDYFVVNCRNVRPLALLASVIDAQSGQAEHTLKHIRCTGFDETYADAAILDLLAKLADGSYSGLDSEGLAGDGYPLPVLEGRITITGNAYEDSVNELRNTFPKLEIVVTGKYYVRFADPEVTRILIEKYGDGTGVMKETVESLTQFSSKLFQSNNLVNTFNELEQFINLESIPAYFASDSMLSEIIFPELIKKIGDYAFYKAPLTGELNLPNLETIGNNAFANTNINKILSLGKIVELKNGTYNYDGIFNGCKQLQEVTLPETLKSIGSFTFYGCSLLERVVFPESITNIGASAFEKTILTGEISLPNLETIGNNAFISMNITKILSLGKIVELKNGTYSHDGIFNSCKQLQEVILPDTLTNIGNYTFYNCNLLEKVIFPESIINIGGYAFSGTILAGELNLPNLETIGQSAFYKSGIVKISSLGKITTLLYSPNSNYGTFNSCKQLTEAVLPDTLTYIGDYTFCNCNLLEKVICNAITPPSIGERAFYNTSATLKFYVPDESVDAYKTATNWSTYADRIYPLSEYTA